MADPTEPTGFITLVGHPGPGRRRRPRTSPARRALSWWRRSDKRVRLSAAVLAAVLFGWPATSTAQALGFPIFEQTMLALSWFAPAITALDLLFTSQLHQKQDDQDAGAAGDRAGHPGG